MRAENSAASWRCDSTEQRCSKKVLATPITSDARFGIASVTKTFTASGILLLRDPGGLTLDDPVSRYLPDFPNDDHITIKNLLSRPSGFGELPSTAITEDESLPDVVAAIGKQPVYFAPGSSDRYSNPGYVLLAAIIEKAAGEHYQTFVERELFSRAGMTRTRNYSVSEIVAGRTRKYRPGPPPALVWKVPSRSLSSTMGTGSASFTATDLLLWLAAIRNQKIFAPREADYPCRVSLWMGRTKLLRTTGARTDRTPRRRVGSDYYPLQGRPGCRLSFQPGVGFFNRCAKDVAAIVLGKTISPIQVRPAVAVPVSALSKLAGTYRANDKPGFSLKMIGVNLVFSWADSTERQFVRPVGPSALFPAGRVGGHRCGRIRT